MRVVPSGLRAALVAAGIVLMLLMSPAAVHPQSPGSSSAPPMVGSGDARSDGEGPGLTASPVVIAVGVGVLGALTAAGTIIVLRVTRRRGP